MATPHLIEVNTPPESAKFHGLYVRAMFYSLTALKSHVQISRIANSVSS